MSLRIPWPACAGPTFNFRNPSRTRGRAGLAGDGQLLLAGLDFRQLGIDDRLHAGGDGDAGGGGVFAELPGTGDGGGALLPRVGDDALVELGHRVDRDRAVGAEDPERTVGEAADQALPLRVNRRE